MKTSKKILIVEDDRDIRESIEQALEMEGYSVATASNGKEALVYLGKEANPCLVLLDMMMPVMGGREFLDIVIKDKKLSPIPVFILSATADLKNTQGAVGFLKKPVDLDRILETVLKYCK